MRIFPDSDVVIYLVENHRDFRPMVDAALSDLQTGRLVTCAMVRLETLTKPTQNNDHTLGLPVVGDHRSDFRPRFGLACSTPFEKPRRGQFGLRD